MQKLKILFHCFIEFAGVFYICFLFFVFLYSGKPIPKYAVEEPIVDFEQCLEAVKTQVLPLVKPKPFTLKQHTVAAFSYYFERAIESGLIDPFQGGEITVSAYRKKAEEICSIANDEQPFMCFDLTFISVLLREGFGLGDSKKIKVILYLKIYLISQ